MSTTYRTDWSNDAGRIDVSYHGSDLPAARAAARNMSKRYGTAYIIKTSYGQDDGQIAYTNGRADSKDWDTH